MSSTVTERSARTQPSSSRRSAQQGRGPLVDWMLGVVGVVLVFVVASVPLQPREQMIFAVCTALVCLLANHVAGKAVTLFLVTLSLAVSVRYLVWRATDTLEFAGPVTTALGIGLLLAELYAFAMMALGYFQTSVQMHRAPFPLPYDPSGWPAVDVYVTTRDEPLAVVRLAVLAALAMDWPRDKLTIWLLDDGRREEFRQFSDACGIGYISRQTALDDKAGAINNALQQTDGAFICLLDADQVPTRAFLQLTMGWLVQDANVALVQTPQHFYSPDIFQRQLGAGSQVPPAGNLFHGLQQDGNDMWNAACFTGSAAVLRRAALEDVGGLAMQTEAGDLHTTLKLHRRGWDTAYVKAPLAAGLAADRLGLYVDQHAARLRGVLRLLRVDSPLFGSGLNVGQRLCYLQSIGQCLFALPRLALLTAPLVYLLTSHQVIVAPAVALAAYALPHLFHAVVTRARLRQHWRHSFWSAVYETVLALSLVRVTLAAVLLPRRSVQELSAIKPESADFQVTYPNVILAALLLAGVLRGLISVMFFHQESMELQALLLNTVWAAGSLTVLLAALALSRRSHPLEDHVSIPARLPVSLHLQDGRIVSATTQNLSQAGGDIVAARMDGLVDGSDIDIEFELGGAAFMVPARVLRWEQQNMQVRWQPTSIEEESAVIQAVFGRADAWIDWATYPADRPLVSLWRMLRCIGGLFRARRVPFGAASGNGKKPNHRPTRRNAGVVSSVALLTMLLFSAHAGMAQTVVRPIAQPVTKMQQPAASTPAASKDNAGATPALPLPSMPPASTAPAAISAPSVVASGVGGREAVMNLHQLGAVAPLALHGTSELLGVTLGVRSDEVVTSAQLHLTGAVSPGLIPEFSNVTVTMNDQYVGTIPVVKGQPNFNLDLPINPAFFQDLNRLNFRFTGRYAPECNDPMSGLLWATISDASTVTLTLERLPPQRDLARLPLPLFDKNEKAMLTLPFMLAASPGNDALKAAGIVTAWFGNQATFAGASYPVQTEAPSSGNAVMIVVGTEPHAAMSLPVINGPTLAVIANPHDPLSTILLIAGRTGDEVITAATSLALGNRGLAGAEALVQPVTAAARTPYDAPNWINADAPVKFGALVSADDLQSTGYSGLLHVPFKTAPDLYTWHDRGFPLDLHYRAPPGPIVDVAASRLDIGINGVYLRSLSLGQSQDAARFDIPAYDITGANDLQLFFDARPLHRDGCAPIPTDLRMAIDPDSTIDLSRAYHLAKMPNLQFFANSGFPFTRMADLSETAVVLPDHPTASEISSYLSVMGRLGAITGYPPLRMAVVRPDAINSVSDRNLLVIGTLQHLQGASSLLASAPLSFSDNQINVAVSSTFDGVSRWFGDQSSGERVRAVAGLKAVATDGMAALVGAESPLARHRSVVAILAASSQSLEQAIAALSDADQSSAIQGDLALLSGGHVTSYHVGAVYTVGRLPMWLYPSYLLANQPYGLVLVLLIGCGLAGLAWFWTMRRRATARSGQTTPPTSLPR